MLVKLMKALEATPEGAGSMMDNTLIVYSSNNAAVSYTHLRAHETVLDLVCRLLLEKKKKYKHSNSNYDL